MTYPARFDVPLWFSIVWTVANAAIFFGYVLIASAVMPIAGWRLRTKLMGILFFVTCGLTHAEMVIHLLFQPWATVAQSTYNVHMAADHIVQAVAVLFFTRCVLTDVRMRNRRRDDP